MESIQSQQRSMIRCDYFAGNYKTGEFKNKSMELDSAYDDSDEEIIDELLNAIDWDHGVWAVYRDGESIDDHIEDFKRYMAHCRERKEET